MGEISFNFISPWILAKIFVLFGLLIYILFGLVVARQIKLMTDTLQTGNEGIIKIIGFAHLLFTIAVFIFALIIL